MSAIEKWLESIVTAYTNESDEQFIKRATGWKASGDTCALLYACLAELRAMREALEQQTPRTTVKR